MKKLSVLIGALLLISSSAFAQPKKADEFPKKADEVLSIYNPSTGTITATKLAANNINLTALATPGSITITQVGTAGAVTVTYKLVARLADGSTTEAGAASTTTTSNATLTTTNFNRLTWSAVTGAYGYDIYRTVSPTTPSSTGKINSTVITGLTFDDTAKVGDSSVAPTTNSTGKLVGSVSGVSDSTNALKSATTSINVSSATAPTAGQVLTATSSTAATWQSTPLSCQAGLGDGLNAITAGTYVQVTCVNTTGRTWNVSSLSCYTDNTGTSTMNVTNGAASSFLTGAITCTPSFAAGTQSATVSLANNDYLKFTFVSDGTTKQTLWLVNGNY